MSQSVSLFTDKPAIRSLLQLSAELTDLAAVAGVLEWDQETYMPVKGGEDRGFQLATISAVYHEKITALPVAKLLAQAGKETGTVYDRALVREFAREHQKATKLPAKLVKEISQQSSRAIESWRKAKIGSDYALFLPDLEKNVTLKIEAAKLLREKGQTLYDALLDDYEPGLTEQELDRIFTPLQPRLTDLVAILEPVTDRSDTLLAGKQFPGDAMLVTSRELAVAMGYDLDAGRLDTSPHPFTTEFGITDVRITTWIKPDDLLSVLMATIHETGHALHFQGVDRRLNRTHLAGGPGLGMDESQSRFWENIVGRSPEFWHFWFPKLQKTFPRQLSSLTREQFTKSVNTVRPSPVRVEADEVTYGLHIILRFDIERKLIAGSLAPKDLPKVWQEKMRQYLGVVPDSDTQGVLQDIHWAHGSFGYFPTYLLGSLISTQLWQTMKKTLPDVEKMITRGDLLPIREWLRENIHQYGRVYPTNELVQRVTGEPLSAECFINYLKEKYSRIYGVLIK